MEKKQTKKETVETVETVETLTETDILESMENLLVDYINSKVKTNSVLSKLAGCWFVLYGYNNIGACKKIIKTLTNERNLFIRYLDFNGLSVVWNVKTDELTVRKFVDFTFENIASFETFLEHEKERKEDERKESLKDLTVFKKEYEKKVKTLFKGLNDSQTETLKQLLKTYL